MKLTNSSPSEFIGVSESVQEIRELLSVSVQEIRELISVSANSDKVRVHISGETGVGKELVKELVARSIHQESARAKMPFESLDCGALVAESLVDDQLFGHRKGAFEGAYTDQVGIIEKSSGGTLFFDETANMPAYVQSKLLRVLQEGEVQRVGENSYRPVDLRVITATNENLKLRVDENKFRRDLYRRLVNFTIYVPPLRDRPEDIPVLIDHLLKRLQREFKRTVTIAKDAVTYLQGLEWKENVRELEDSLKKAYLWAQVDSRRKKGSYLEAIELQIADFQREQIVAAKPAVEAPVSQAVVSLLEQYGVEDGVSEEVVSLLERRGVEEGGSQAVVSSLNRHIISDDTARNTVETVLQDCGVTPANIPARSDDDGQKISNEESYQDLVNTIVLVQKDVFVRLDFADRLRNAKPQEALIQRHSYMKIGCPERPCWTKRELVKLMTEVIRPAAEDPSHFLHTKGSGDGGAVTLGDFLKVFSEPTLAPSENTEGGLKWSRHPPPKGGGNLCFVDNSNF